ncbi:sensor histidine kinase [Cohnella nanjingensis]|uniref:histidine kinase n=2 Tax=Cohnella nanjingensis TaxID=1387779 RepID=A0A7X0RT12_9BACL|nr:sensor histidine kinase [Cohnella nanjingensis]
MFFKLFLALATASLLVLSGLLYSALSSSREALIRQKSDDMTLFIERTGQYLDLYVQNIRNLLINVSASIDGPLMEDDEGLRKLLQVQIGRNSGIVADLFVLRHDGTVLSSNQLMYDVVGHSELTRVFRIVDEHPGLINWSEPYYSPLQTRRTIAFAVALKDGTGALLAEVNTAQLTSRLNELLYDSGQGFTLFTGKGNIVSDDPKSQIVPYKTGTLPPEMEDDFVKELTGLPNGINHIQGKGGPLMAVKSERNQLGWYLVALTDERTFRAMDGRLYVRFMILGSLWFSLLLALTLAISRHFTKPINRLALQMDRLRGERVALPFRQSERRDEIGRLSRSFSTMLEHIQELLLAVKMTEERKKETELKLLLSQIRPHFLYNTLACISSLALQHRVVEVDETIRSLVKLLSYSLGRSQFAPLEEELQALRQYMQIQNVRYGDAFRLVEEVDPSLLPVPVPKLMLQTLVENAIFHGFASKGTGVARVGALAEDGRLLLTVWDDGEGMTQAQIEAVLTGLLHDEGGQAQRSGGIGLANVRERIRLHYGPEYGLRIQSEPGRWTKATIELPLP